MECVKILHIFKLANQQDKQVIKLHTKKLLLLGINPVENVYFQSKDISTMGIAVVGGLAANIRDKKTSFEEYGRFGWCFPSFWGSDGGPWGHSWGRWPPGTWMKPEDAVDGLSGKFLSTTT